MNNLSHVDESGRARMVDVGDKADTDRHAAAEAELRCSPETLAIVAQGRAPKGAVLATAELAGIMGAKRTAELIPLCHPLPLDKVEVRISADDTIPGFRVRAEARTHGRTGVEMEALTAASIACLTLFDMLKAVDRTMAIQALRVIAKSGGRSSDWTER